MRPLMPRLAAAAAIAALATGIALTAPAAAAPSPHGSCAGGATLIPSVGLPAPGPALGPTLAAARGGEPSIGGPGVAEEVALSLSVVCEPRP